MLSFQESIAISQICLYAPAFFLAAFLVFRHGYHRQAGWIYLAIFCVIRIAGSAFKIDESSHPTSETDIKMASILQAVALSPLLLASLGLLKRVIDGVSDHIRSDKPALSNVKASSGVINMILNAMTADSRRSRIIQLSHIPIMIALVLCVIGGLDESPDNSLSERNAGKTHFKFGIVIFLIVYLIHLTLVIITMRDMRNAPRGEKRIYYAVVTALPLLAIRLLWALLSVFSTSPEFSMFNGKPAIQLGMAVVEEFIIVFIYLMAGLFAPSIKENNVVESA